MSEQSHPDVDLTTRQRAAIEALMQREEPIRPPLWMRRGAAIDYETECAHANEDLAGFWAEKAEAIEWFTRWERVLDFDPPHHRWFSAAPSTPPSTVSTATSTRTAATRRRSSGSASPAKSAPTPTTGCTAR